MNGENQNEYIVLAKNPNGKRHMGIDTYIIFDCLYLIIVALSLAM